VSGSWDNTIRFWDAVTGAALQTLEGYSASVNSVAFSPEGKVPSLFVSDEWIVKEEANILWLPPDFRPTCVAVWNRSIVLGHSSGHITFLNIQK
jgi:WD40 repeat protein